MNRIVQNHIDQSTGQEDTDRHVSGILASKAATLLREPVKDPKKEQEVQFQEPVPQLI